MFGKRKPADTPFSHSDDCPTPLAKPEWSYMGNGRWERVCNCHTDYATVSDGKLDPNSAAARPSWRAHEHAPSCEAATVSAVVKNEQREAGGGWRSVCSVCTTMNIFYWKPDATDRNGRPVRREGMIRYQYELERQLVSA